MTTFNYSIFNKQTYAVVCLPKYIMIKENKKQKQNKQKKGKTQQ